MRPLSSPVIVCDMTSWQLQMSSANFDDHHADGQTGRANGTSLHDGRSDGESSLLPGPKSPAVKSCRATIRHMETSPSLLVTNPLHWNQLERIGTRQPMIIHSLTADVANSHGFCQRNRSNYSC